MTKTKICGHCLIDKTSEHYSVKTVNGKPYLFHICKPCRNELDRTRHLLKPEARRERDRKSYKLCGKARNERLSKKRAEGVDREKFIYWDSRCSDRRKGLENDLDKEFISSLITQSCTYCGCGADKEQMTLDRIDNAIGHVKTNVVPSCFTCNYVRRDMPHDTWLVVAKGMAVARSLGLLDKWKPKLRKG